MSELQEVGFGCAMIAVIFAVVIAVSLFFKAQACHARFEGSKLQSDWGIISGCRVLTPDQGWIPAQNYRVL